MTLSTITRTIAFATALASSSLALAAQIDMNADANDVAIKGYDTVSYFSKAKPVKESTKYTATCGYFFKCGYCKNGPGTDESKSTRHPFILFHPAGHSARLLKHRLYTGSAWSLWSGIPNTKSRPPRRTRPA